MENIPDDAKLREAGSSTMSAMRNPWNRTEVTPSQAVLLALSIEPQTLAEIAAKTGMPADAAQAALQRSIGEGLAIYEDEKYELSGPISWFGTYESALRYYVRRNFIVQSGPQIHLYVTDIRVKHGRPVGDPLTETLAVFACGKTAHEIRPAQSALTCPDCSRVADA